MTRRILIVDNHPALLKFMAGLLSKEGHQVLTAVDGLSALSLLETFAPEIMFIDLIMPNIDGEKLCRIIRGKPELQDIYIIILSAIAADEEVDFVGFGANACIAKGPFEQMGRHVLAALMQADSNGLCPSHMTTIGRDGLRSRAITRELLSVKHHFEAILESMTEGVLEITGDGKIVYANPTASTLIGVSEENLLAADLVHFFQGSDRERILNLLTSKASSMQCILEDSPLILNGRQISLKLLPSRGGGAERIVILDDVTERMRMEARLVQGQRMEAIGRLAGGIAHDFNNALTVIIGNTILAKLRAQHGESIDENMDNVEKASWKARDLTQQLLPFSKGGRPIKRLLSLPSVLRDMCRDFVEDSQVQCDCSMADDLWQVEIDVNQVRQAISNLMHNAARSMPEGGAIRVHAENSRASTDWEVPMSERKYVKISIHDQGGGIPEQQLATIFEPCLTIGMDGSGLGLACTHAIIHQHGGCINVESELGVGTTFHILLPAVEADLSATRTLHARPDGAKATVLVMDDEDMVLEVAGDMLSHLGYSVVMARNGAEAIQIYRKAYQAAEPFDAVITDLTVPGGMGGQEMIKELLKIDPSVRAIVSSGYCNDPIMADYREYGFCGVLEKPYRISALRDELDRILRERGPSPGIFHVNPRRADFS